jgi:hypothetical protein
MTRKERSYLLPKLSAADRKLLSELPRAASLADEIDYLRLRLAREAEDPESDSNRMLHILQLLTRMVSVQAKLGNGGTDTVAELIEVVRKRLADGATPEEALR